eukprot:jgi/Undpi1/5377/HiC_scaffold_2.g00658.m1
MERIRAWMKGWIRFCQLKRKVMTVRTEDPGVDEGLDTVLSTQEEGDDSVHGTKEDSDLLTDVDIDTRNQTQLSQEDGLDAVDDENLRPNTNHCYRRGNAGPNNTG